ncbi:MAG: hypothetical protein FJY99_01585 [Candidatus Sericytochromatia bacterium]|nr:hypothetical protein [Candidatus Tanganyikabacteria bacterium]
MVGPRCEAGKCVQPLVRSASPSFPVPVTTRAPRRNASRSVLSQASVRAPASGVPHARRVPMLTLMTSAPSRAFREAGGVLWLCGLRPEVRGVADLLGLPRVTRVHEDVEEARAALRAATMAR